MILYVGILEFWSFFILRRSVIHNGHVTVEIFNAMKYGMRDKPRMLPRRLILARHII